MSVDGCEWLTTKQDLPSEPFVTTSSSAMFVTTSHPPISLSLSRWTLCLRVSFEVVSKPICTTFFSIYSKQPKRFIQYVLSNLLYTNPLSLSLSLRLDRLSWIFCFSNLREETVGRHVCREKMCGVMILVRTLLLPPPAAAAVRLVG